MPFGGIISLSVNRFGTEVMVRGLEHGRLRPLFIGSQNIVSTPRAIEFELARCRLFECFTVHPLHYSNNAPRAAFPDIETIQLRLIVNSNA